MHDQVHSPEERYLTIVQALADQPGIRAGSDRPGNRFGSRELKVGGKIFAMLSQGRLVLKLPRQRVDALIESGIGQRYDPRRNGSVMKEWVTVDPAADTEWLALAREAMAFVASLR